MDIATMLNRKCRWNKR